MTALDAVSVYTPAFRVPIENLADPLGLTDMQVRLFRRFHGLGEIRFDPDRSLADLLRTAATGIDELRGREHRVRYVVYGRAMPVVVPYPRNPLHEVCGELGLGHALTFTVTQQSCASGLLAVQLAGRLLAGDPADGALALVLTGEKAFTRDARLLPGTSIFGEGSAACLVSATGKRDRLLSYACDQRGEFDAELGEPNERFQREYRPALAEVIRRAVADAGLTLDDIRLVLPHNVNIVTWQRLCLLLDFPVERVMLSNVPINGHLFCADAFANYQTARERGLLCEGDRYLVAAVGAGAGATFAAMVFQH
ncbi:3-oxoacyl-[acyl-carrier-protein] synthase III C-terminal domain-containing protein [Actinophytocola sp.]|uniref:3-oxoacyl-[acyl-carrier-protein] synthase III C-terminal domain-containing protein n=1 Tax=Actinophytocola sp. TaxID=1872138 RepID=UPI002D7F2DBA|nr:3-oxoacyl-[acyl-carrier-protein] synthase III C-terminal domain-containing protein [Actinophytocola sp.]HET9143139.1 3-oxoacyl-[acyl-carrier-protein] synthase III C-terminal domain-containing protein [Actinophytocola sp.]